MRPISADVACSVCVCVSVCLPVCVSVEHDHDFCAKTTEAIEMQFTAFTRVDPCNRVFSGGPDYLRGRGVFFGEGDFPVHKKTNNEVQVSDLQNILRQYYDYLTIMPKLRSTYHKRLIY